MNTTSVSPAAIGQDDFPVLLRVPDLNTPVWGSAVSSQVAAVATPASMPASQVAVPEVATAALQEQPAATATASQMPPAVSLLQTALDGCRRTAAWMKLDDFGQWPLTKKLTTGGIVAGAVLTVTMFMRGSDEPATDPSTAPATFDLPRIEIARPASVAVTPVDAGPNLGEPSPASADRFENIQSPSKVVRQPDLSNDAMPVAAEQRIDGNLATSAFPQPASTQGADAWNQSRMKPLDVPNASVPVGQSYASRYVDEQRRWDAAPPVGEATMPVYPTTDPQNFQFRIVGQSPPEAARPGMARLEGIAPPPRR